MFLEEMFSLKDKVVVVTGGSSGIGMMMAEGFLQAGARVVITSRKEAQCQEAAAALSAFGPCRYLAANVARAEDRQALVDSLRDNEGRVDVLVNNAGTAWSAPIDNYPDEAFRKVMELNVDAVFALTRDLLPLLGVGAGPDSPSRVINIGSKDGLHVSVTHEDPTFAYGASKAAVHHLTRYLAVDLAKERQAKPRGARYPGAFAAALLLCQPGRRPEQRQEYYRL